MKKFRTWLFPISVGVMAANGVLDLFQGDYWVASLAFLAVAFGLAAAVTEFKKERN